MIDFSELTPMMRQYTVIKQQNQEHLLFYRLGDFYELFYEDAILASKLLDITLTKRGTAEKTIPMAGVPAHAANSYISKLIRLNKTVAICEQVSEASPGSGIVERKVVKIITPGTAIEEGIIDSKDTLNLCSVFYDKDINQYIICSLDVGTGDFQVYFACNNLQLIDKISIICPNEIVISQNDLLPILKNHCLISVFEKCNVNDLEAALTKCSTQFINCKDGLNEATAKTAFLLISYAEEMLQHNLDHVRKLSMPDKSHQFGMDSASFSSLEIFKNYDGSKKNTLCSLLDKTASNMGGRLFKKWMLTPTTNKKIIMQRLDAIESIKKINYEEIAEILKQVQELDRVLGRIALNKAKPYDLVRLRTATDQFDSIIEFLEKHALNEIELLTEVYNSIPKDHALKDMLHKAIKPVPNNNIKDGGVIADGYDEELDELRNINENATNFILNYEIEQRALTGVNNLKIGYNRVHGYYIEISKAQSHENLPESYIRRQTLKNAERYTTRELDEFEKKVLSSSDRAISYEKELFENIISEINAFLPTLQNASYYIAMLDVLQNLAERSDTLRLSRPMFSNIKRIDIEDGRHTVIEQMLSKPYISNQCIIDDKSSLHIITGPNMGGKSTYMRQVALITYLSHIGSYVPADRCLIGNVDGIFTRIGASDNITMGESTFMVEMKETANIINNITENSLVILDEIGRGTSTFDGLSLAWAVAEYLSLKRCYTLFATHYFEMTELATIHSNVDNYHVEVMESEGKLQFLYKVKKGSANRSYGIQVAKLAGLPSDLIRTAEEKLNHLEGAIN